MVNHAEYQKCIQPSAFIPAKCLKTNARMAFAMICSVDFLIWRSPNLADAECPSNSKIYHKLLLYTERDLFLAANRRVIVPSADCGTVVSDVFSLVEDVISTVS